MYRYSQQVRSNVTNQNWKRRVINILFVLLLIASVSLTILYSKSMNREKRYIEKYENQIVFEIGQATSQMNTLSRTGGSGTSNLLGKIRQRIYAIEILQVQYNTVFGNKATRQISPIFNEIYTLLDHFDEALIAGKTTKDVQTMLSEKISALQTEILAMVNP